jgi:RNA polymerase subunit RPABC4/transcription elongation factor Spt4
MAKYCSKCRHIRKITKNKKAKCCVCGLTKLVSDFIALTDKQKLKMLKFELRMK